MNSFVSIYGGSGYGMAYSCGDAIFAFSIFLAMCMLIAGGVIQSHREGFSLYDQPRILIMLSVIGLLYVLFGWPLLLALIITAQHYGHHGQWIAILLSNVAAWIFFWRCVIPRAFSQKDLQVR